MMLGAFGAMQSLLGLSSQPSEIPTSAANITSNPAMQQFIERSMSYLPSWMQVDMSLLVAAFFIAGYMWQPLILMSEHAYWAIVRFFTASISITQSDRLNVDVVQYIATEVIPNGGARVLTARSEYIGPRNRYWARPPLSELAGTGINDPMTDGRVKPIEYLPGFQTIVFRFGWTIMMVTRVNERASSPFDKNKDFNNAPSGDEPVVVMCLGRSIEPIKRFLEHCRSFNAHHRDQWVAVRIPRSEHDYSSDSAWDEPVIRPARPLTTVHFDDAIKKDLIQDIRSYLDPATKSFYLSRGIPYRRGYLLHGPPGTGKSSLSLALASLCQLDLYLVHLPSLGYHGDRLLSRLFQALPSRCIVLIEDIDAVGLRRDLKKPGEARKRSKNPHAPPMPGSGDAPPPTCTLSGLLNVLDGVASQEGRIVLMTSNHPEKLDPALIRPGRIDKRVYLGHIDPDCASSMFMRMFASEAKPEPEKPRAEDKKDPNASPLIAWDSAFVRSEMREMRLATQAAKFAAQVPEKTFTPAQLQGFLLRHRGAPEDAVEKVAEWVPAEIASMKEAEEWKKLLEQQLMEEWEAQWGDGDDDEDDVKGKEGKDDGKEKDAKEDSKEDSKEDGKEDGKEDSKDEGKDEGKDTPKPAKTSPAKDEEDDVKPPQVNSKVARRKTEPLEDATKKALPNGVAEDAKSVETGDDAVPTPVDSD